MISSVIIILIMVASFFSWERPEIMHVEFSVETNVYTGV